MTKHKFNPTFSILMIFILVAGLMRILNAVEATAISNFTPLGAMALFGGSYFNPKWKAFAFPLLAFLLGDVIINTFIYGGVFGSPIIYLIFTLIVVVGMLMMRKVNVANIFSTSLVSTLIFWMIADCAVWARGGRDIRTNLPLSRDFEGLLQSYTQGFPFVINFFLGTLIYSAIMFGTFELIRRKYSLLTVSK